MQHAEPNPSLTGDHKPWSAFVWWGVGGHLLPADTVSGQSVTACIKAVTHLIKHTGMQLACTGSPKLWQSNPLLKVQTYNLQYEGMT